MYLVVCLSQYNMTSSLMQWNGLKEPCMVVCLSEYKNTLSVLSHVGDQAVGGMIGDLFV